MIRQVVPAIVRPPIATLSDPVLTSSVKLPLMSTLGMLIAFTPMLV